MEKILNLRRKILFLKYIFNHPAPLLKPTSPFSTVSPAGPSLPLSPLTPGQPSLPVSPESSLSPLTPIMPDPPGKHMGPEGKVRKNIFRFKPGSGFLPTADKLQLQL